MPVSNSNRSSASARWFRTFVISAASVAAVSGMAMAMDDKEAAKQPAKDATKEAPKEVAAEPTKINVGSKAPALKVGKYVKGKQAEALAKNGLTGKPAVVEFWATWCGPCKVSIPHLSELSKKFDGKVTFVGVSVWERGEDTDSKVQKFVDGMGEKMDYNVAVDTGDKFMADNWMKAADQNGIPAAFIVDKDGVIAWIGHPMDDEFEKVLGHVSEGTWTADMAKKMAAEKAEKEAAMEKIQGFWTDANKLARKKDYPAAIAKLDEAIAAAPADMRTGLYQTKFNWQLKSDETAAYATAKTLAATDFKDNAQGLNAIAWTILDTADLKTPDLALALSLAERANTISKDDPMLMDTLGLAQFKNKQVDAAIATQEKAVKLTKEAGDKYPEEMLTELQGRLDEFKKAKAGPT